MERKGIGALTLLAVGLSLTLSGCGQIDESVLNTQANFSVDISVPYATATPLPQHLNVPEAIVIDSKGNVTLNDASLIEGNFQSAMDAENETAYSSLSIGNNGIAVQALQARLQELGYFEGDVTGLFDMETEDAVKRFEQTYGTMQTGVATPKLQMKLFASNAPVYGSAAYDEAIVAQYTVLRPGTVGSSVYALQQRLKSLGYPITDLNGVYDHQTVLSVQLFYETYRLNPSDIANVAMQKELYSDTALTYDPERSFATMPPDNIPAADDSNETGLSIGDSGEAVAQAQQRLIELGYLTPENDLGVFDAPTEHAVNQFLANTGRSANGILTDSMRDYLFSDDAPAYNAKTAAALYIDLNVGDSGEAVMDLQRRLVTLGYANGTPNGIYGNATITAVKFFQKCNGMTEDGIASVSFQTFLYSSEAPTYAEISGANTSDDPFASGVVSNASQPTGANDTIYFNLTNGSTGNAVMKLQNRLVELEYLKSANGFYDDETVKAVSQFQIAIGVHPTGDASASFQRYIFTKAAPKRGITLHDSQQDYKSLTIGDTGEAVEKLQRKLWELGFLSKDSVQNSVGTFNEATGLAVASAQLKMGYESSDGVAGIEFQSFIYSKYSEYLK